MIWYVGSAVTNVWQQSDFSLQNFQALAVHSILAVSIT
jgi:hypothetical protein